MTTRIAIAAALISMLALGCADATTDPVTMSLDADASVAPEAGAPDAKLLCPPNDRGENCVSPPGGRTFKGRYACAMPNGRLEVGCTYDDGQYQVLIVASCAECAPPGS